MISMGVCDSYYDIKYIIYVYISIYILEYIPSVSIRKWWNESETFVIQHRNTKIILFFHFFNLELENREYFSKLCINNDYYFN